jgi:hypothetical protein
MDTRTDIPGLSNIPDVQISLDHLMIITTTPTQRNTRMRDQPPHHPNRDPTILPQRGPCPNPQNLTPPTTVQSVVHETTLEVLTLHHTTKVIHTTNSLDLHPFLYHPPHTIPQELSHPQQVSFERLLLPVMAPPNSLPSSPWIPPVI